MSQRRAVSTARLSTGAAAHPGLWRHYVGSDDWEQWQRYLDTNPEAIPARVHEARTALTATSREIDQGIPRACREICQAIH